MKKFLAVGSIALGIAFALSFVGCGPKPFDGGVPAKVENIEIKYTQDKLGFCYAFVDNVSAFGFHIVGMTHIPCDELQARLKAVQEAQAGSAVAK